MYSSIYTICQQKSLLCVLSRFKVNFLKMEAKGRIFNSLKDLVAHIYEERNDPKNQEKMYEYLDTFIENNQPTDGISGMSISHRDLVSGKKLYNEMKNDPKIRYEIFGSNGGGYTCFSLYKNKGNHVYLIVIDGHNDNEPTDFVKIENEDIFGV